MASMDPQEGVASATPKLFEITSSYPTPDTRNCAARDSLLLLDRDAPDNYLRALVKAESGITSVEISLLYYGCSNWASDSNLRKVAKTIKTSLSFYGMPVELITCGRTTSGPRLIQFKIGKFDEFEEGVEGHEQGKIEITLGTQEEVDSDEEYTWGE
jgi:hypothetical protein